MFVDLVLTVCLAAGGGDCHKEHVLLDLPGLQNQCLNESPIYIAQWVGEHPRWHVTEWKYERPGTDQDDDRI